MIEVNNFDTIISNLSFSDKSRSIILVWVVKRNKDGNTTAKGNNKNRTIKSYYIQSVEQLEEKKSEIIDLCKYFNCRAYICISPKPILKVLFSLHSIVIHHIEELYHKNCVISLKGMMDSAVMLTKLNKNKRLWVVDIDTKDENIVSKTITDINSSISQFSSNVIYQLPTAHGYHLITHPFDTRTVLDPTVEIKKDGLTLLYAYLND